MPVVENRLISHTFIVISLLITEMAGSEVITKPTKPSKSSAGLKERGLGLVGALSLVAWCWMPAHAHARDQESIKADAKEQIRAAAASAFYIEAKNVEVRLADKRLVLPNCTEAFEVTFPFSDRATAQLDCLTPQWRGFIQIRLREGVPAFRYNLPLNAGDILKRSHVIRQSISTEDVNAIRVTVLEDVLDKKLKQRVQAGEILLENHFAGAVTGTSPIVDDGGVGAWIANEIIPRGSRLSQKSFSWGIVNGRVPSDLIHQDAQFPMLEALRNIMPGDKLRRSAVKMAPAVRKNEEVQVSIVRGSLTVTNVVRVGRDATIGETIEVINAESGRSLRARVTGIGQVEIL
ncbi:MAG: flagella basal body P-ring formation protein FlgA [Halieaceae bacterium]|nr:flagella basal body P-ring formation protein FlgA [Halieaceae bacterium]